LKTALPGITHYVDFTGKYVGDSIQSLYSGKEIKLSRY